MGKSNAAKTKGQKTSRRAAAARDRRLAKKLDSLCLAASVVIIAVTALLELRDRRISGERPLR